MGYSQFQIYLIVQLEKTIGTYTKKILIHIICKLFKILNSVAKKIVDIIIYSNLKLNNIHKFTTLVLKPVYSNVKSDFKNDFLYISIYYLEFVLIKNES